MFNITNYNLTGGMITGQRCEELCIANNTFGIEFGYWFIIGLVFILGKRIIAGYAMKNDELSDSNKQKVLKFCDSMEFAGIVLLIIGTWLFRAF